MYNAPEIIIKNIDNLVYKDIPYQLEFDIKPPTLISSITEEFNFDRKILFPDTSDSNNGVMYEYDIDKNMWEFDSDGNVEIYGFDFVGKEYDILAITGRRLIEYTYKVYFNENEIEHMNTPMTGYGTSTVNILVDYFNNFVDGKIKIEVIYANNLVEVKTYNVQLVNTAPNILFSDIINNKLNLTVTDDDSDPIKLSIKLNGRNYFPSSGGFTDYLDTPYFYSTHFSSDELNINLKDFATPNNIITVTVIDKYGAETQMHKAFVGEFIGVMFVDENNDFYSDDTNRYEDDANILKEQYLGNIRAGTQGDKKLTYVLNKTQFKLTNIKLILNTVGIPDKTYVKLSKNLSTNFSNMSSELDFENLQLDIGEKLPFYVQANTEVLSLGGGYYYIDVIADPVE